MGDGVKTSDKKTLCRGNETLTDEEREAVETAAQEADAHQHTARAATLRGLLERLN